MSSNICYRPMDRLLARQSAIRRTLTSRHLKEGHVVLYDINSSYLEGAYTQSDIVTFGYDRDGKRGHEQMVIALLCNSQGCPVGVEVFAGNTQDASTVPGKIAQLQRHVVPPKKRTRNSRFLWSVIEGSGDSVPRTPGIFRFGLVPAWTGPEPVGRP